MDIAQRIRSRKISSVEVVRSCLQRIEERNAEINAFITILADDALARAADADAEIAAGKWRGPLHGVPVAIKDFYDTAGVLTTAAFEKFKSRIPTKDAVSVARLKEAGAIIIGKTNMHRLGMGTTGLESAFGPVSNPLNADFIAGGSSSGSAAAVASEMCFASLDTDAIGSCRLPAACCGVVGFKGTYGLVSTQGILEGEEPPDETIIWLSHAGITTRSVQDTAIMLDALAKEPIGEIGSERSFRVGVATKFKADREVKNAFERAVEEIQMMAGVTLFRATPPTWKFRSGIGKIEEDRKTVATKAFDQIDVLILPTTTTPTLSIRDAQNDEQALSADNTMFANYYGLPAISVPRGFDADGLPSAYRSSGNQAMI